MVWGFAASGSRHHVNIERRMNSKDFEDILQNLRPSVHQLKLKRQNSDLQASAESVPLCPGVVQSKSRPQPNGDALV